jgi:hypothetical protein
VLGTFVKITGLIFDDMTDFKGTGAGAAEAGAGGAEAGTEVEKKTDDRNVVISLTINRHRGGVSIILNRYKQNIILTLYKK